MPRRLSEASSRAFYVSSVIFDVPKCTKYTYDVYLHGFVTNDSTFIKSFVPDKVLKKKMRIF